MRQNRPQKARKYAIRGAVAGGIIYGGRSAYLQLRDLKEGEKFDWWKLARDILIGAGAAGFIGWSIGTAEDYFNSLEAPIDTDAVLLKIARDAVLQKDDPVYMRLAEKASWLIGLLQQHYDGRISRVHRYGSSENGCALKGNLDVDRGIDFLPGAFSSIDAMFTSVGEYLESLIGQGGILRIRKQHVSFGIYFSVLGAEYKVDITLVKLSGDGNNTAGYLYRNNTGLFDTPGRTKTDISLLKNMELKETQKKILVLLKIWKQNEALPLSSSLLQLLIPLAYDAYRGVIPRKFTDKLILVVQFIADNIESIVVQSPENTNNILTDRMTATEKDIVRRACVDMLDDYAYQPNSVIEYFE